MIKKLTHLAVLISVFLGANSAFAQGYETIVKGLDNPWAMEFLPNEDILITERTGQLRIVRDGKLLDAPVQNVPDSYYAGQGGLLDIKLDINFADNQRLYLSFAHGKRSANSARLISAKLVASDDGYSLENINVLFSSQPEKRTAHHYGARIEQMADSTLVMTVGDGFNYREQAQTLDNHFGKIIRINTDGSIPKDNPFVETKDALPEIYSFGHRNQQGLAIIDNQLFEHEHGPRGGDEVNRITPGSNFGWPIATFGIDYNGARISPFSSYEGTVSPLVDWTPSIAPSAMTAKGEYLYVTSLAEGSIRKLEVTPSEVNDLGVVFPELSMRLRDIAVGLDGRLYVLTDGSSGKLIKIVE